MLPRTGSKGQRERQQLTDRIVCDRDGFVMPEHGSRTPAAELSDQVRQSTEQAVDGACRHPGLGCQPTNRERFYAASPDAIVRGLGGRQRLRGAMKSYEKQRNVQTKPAFDWTLHVAQLRGVSPIEERLFRAIGADQVESSNFFGMLTGTVPVRSVFSPSHLIRLVGVRDFLELARARSRQ